ncbi:hypothetical protein AQF52_6986 [Streptomyces venezuelae]|nr:hypothetical protein AQF52_6986 [Streptomyces venezuelae]CUM36796.1 hypothetical protein BN2537_2557 [Streptomyces venezuelae]
MNFLLFLACSFLAGALPALWGNWRDRSRGRAFASGRAVGVPAEVVWQAGDGPRGEGRPARGDLWLVHRVDEPVRFVAESAVLTVPRGGRVRDVVPLRSGGFTRPSFVHRDTVVYEVPGMGRVLEITVERPSTGIVTKALSDPGDGEPTPRRTSADALRFSLRNHVRMPGVAALLLTGALALGLFGVHTFGLGRDVTAEVTGVRDAECQVEWQDPWEASRTQHARVDCYQGEQTGDALRISARPWPVRGEAADLEDSWFMTVFGVSVAGAAGLVGVIAATAGDARRLRRLRNHLRGSGRTPRQSPRRLVVPWWSWAAGVLGLSGIGLLTFAYVFGQIARAEVTGTTEYGCAVAWADPWDGARQTAEVDCDQVDRGDTLEVSALPWPLRGEAFDRDFTPVALGFVTALGTAAALAGIGLRTRRARVGIPLTAVALPTRMPPVAALEKPSAGDPAEAGDVLARSHLAAVSRLLLARSAFAPAARKRRPEPDPSTGPWWRSPVLRRITLASGVAWGALIVLALTCLLSGWWWVTAVRLSTDRPVTATATVELLYDELPLEPWLLPSVAEMSFVTADGRRIVTDVVVSEPAPAEGDTVGIEYAAGQPSAARIPGDPGYRRGLWVSGTVAALAIGRLAWCAARTGRTLRRVLRAARSPEARTLDYLVLPGGEEPASEAPMLVLFESGADRPIALMDVEPGAVHLPHQGTTQLRSTAEDPAAAVAFVGGGPVWPMNPLTDLTDEEEREAFTQYVTDLVPLGVTLGAPDTTDYRLERPADR